MKTTFNKIKNGQTFHIDYNSGRWIAYKKQVKNGNNAVIIATFDNDTRAINNPVSISNFQIVNI